MILSCDNSPSCKAQAIEEPTFENLDQTLTVDLPDGWAFAHSHHGTRLLCPDCARRCLGLRGEGDS